MAPKDWYVFYFCFQRPVLEKRSYCPCQALSMYCEEVILAQESYSSINQKKVGRCNKQENQAEAPVD